MHSEPSAHEIEHFVLSRLTVLTGVSKEMVDRQAPLHQYGLDSRNATELITSLSEFLGRRVPITSIWANPTLASLCHTLTGGSRADADSVGEGNGRRVGAQASAEPIALVGLGCRLPRSPDPASFWRLLVDGEDAVGISPPARWNGLPPATGSSSPGEAAPRWGGFLDDIDLFDPLFFGISPREAGAMDPQQRLVLELAWEALEDAGISPDGLRGSETGVFVGSSWSDYAALAYQTGGPDDIGPHTATGAHDSIIANRVSYVFGLEGPSMAVDTACSSSLVAVHLACQSLWTSESELCLAGGVNLNFFANHFLAMDRIGALSPDGRCKAFDARANGIARAEGAALVVLAPLSIALSRGLPVYCLIRGTAVNNDGLSNGLTAPNPRAQVTLLRNAYRKASISPSLVDYVECHGTGTVLGDPIEAQALGTVLGADREADNALRIGSVKTNLGHLEPAAGIAGLVKVALAVRNGVLPASLHYSRPNPRIPFDTLKLKVQDRTTSWPRRGNPRRAGVSAFGFGGTNCHVVVEELPHPEGASLLMAEESAQALSARVDELRARLADGTIADLPAACHGTRQASRQGAFRLSATARSVSELNAQLDAFAAGRPRTGLDTGESGTWKPRVAFLCSGTGSQWAGMGRQLLVGMPAFRESILRSDERMRELLGLSVIDRLLAPEKHSQLDNMEVTQPLIFCLQVALSDAWRSVGVQPDLVLGQSIGEFAAAYLSGALTFADATLLAASNARLVHRMAAGLGGSVVVDAGAERVDACLDTEESAWIAGYNGPTSTLVSGVMPALEALLERLAAGGVTSHWVRIGYPSHTPLMEPVMAPLRAEIGEIIPRQTRIPLVSTVTANLIDGTALEPAYWADNLRHTSKLMQSMKVVAANEIDVIIELSPHAVLLKPMRETLAGTPITCLPSLQREQDEAWSLLRSLGKLHTMGYPVPDHSFLAGTRGRHTSVRPRGEPVSTSAEAETVGPVRLIPVTAHTQEALQDTCRGLSNHVERDPGLSITDLAYTLGTRRTHQSHRFAFLATSRVEVLDALSRFASAEPHPDAVAGTAANGTTRRIAYVFSGAGTQWHGMGRDLLRSNSEFRERMESCDAAVRAVAGWSVLEELRASPERSRLDDTDVNQPVIWAIQVSLAHVWGCLGVTPDVIIGHSVGEVAAGCVAGALSLEDGARVVCVRSRLIHKMPAGHGGMLVVELPEESLLSWIASRDGQLTIAALNGPTSSVVSGTTEAVRALEQDLRHAGISARAVNVVRAGHGPHMDPLLEPMREELANIEPRPFTVPFHSTALEDTVNPRVDASYWAHNLRNQVRFAPTVAELIRVGVDTFIEINARSVLSGAIDELALAHNARVHVVSSLHRAESDTRCLLRAAASLFVRGIPLTLGRLFPDGARVVETPQTCWQKQRYWLNETPARQHMPSAGRQPEHTADSSGTSSLDGSSSQSPEALVLDEVSQLLQIPVTRLGADSRLRDFGLDSMLAIRLSNKLQTVFGHRISPVSLLDGETVSGLARQLVGTVDNAAERGAIVARPVPSASAPSSDWSPIADFVDELSDEDAEELVTALTAFVPDPP